MGWIKDNWQGLVLGTVGTETVKSLFGSAKTFDWSVPIAKLAANPPMQSSTLSVLLMIGLPIIYYSRWKFDFDRASMLYIMGGGGLAVGYFIPLLISVFVGNAGLYANEINSWTDSLPFVVVVVWLAIDMFKAMVNGLTCDPPAVRRHVSKAE